MRLTTSTTVPWKHPFFAACAMLVLHAHPSWAEDLPIREIKLPPLVVNGQPARAHTQGLEVLGAKFYVTARRDDVLPKRALLLRTDAARADWDVWDITPVDPRGMVTTLDHPGGMQSDGTRLWIPLAESKRQGRSVIRAFPIVRLIPGQALEPDFQFEVNDHIGAVAVDPEHKLVLGANWDTEAVYVWDFHGRLQRTLKGSALTERGLGVVSGTDGRAGLAVQDWKFQGDHLFASGLFRTPGGTAEPPQSRWITFGGFLESEFRQKSVALPVRHRVELGQEGMAVLEQTVYFLPEDLGPSSRLFSVPRAELEN
ncbi:MAG: hypothetical protein FJ398_09480 [Verrucomicrobia bacterium]|nr:hypothetical protein [Verrucomicrobiota bacterium]